MAVFTYTITDPGGVDLSLFFPGLIATRYTGAFYNPTAGGSTYRLVENGIPDATKSYTTEFVGTGFSFPTGDGGVAGRISSGTLSVTEAALPERQLATLSIALGSFTTTLGGIDIAASLDMTPDTIMRFAHRLDTGGARLVLNGGAGNDTLPGSDSADTLDGGRGADRLIGAGGDDFYVVDSALDVIVEEDNDGFDSVVTTVEYRLADGESIEKLSADAASGGIGLTGNGFANQLFGNGADNRLDGGAGADAMSGLLGNDTYLVDNALDVVNEVNNEGLDTVLTSVSFSLGALASVETLQASDTGATTSLALTGNAFANVIVGNAGANILRGEAGNDRLDGRLGKDFLTGGDGLDIFAFTAKLTKPVNVDRITDFKVADDTVWLENSIFKGLGKAGSLASPRKLKADEFWSGAAAHDASDRIIHNKATGALFLDLDGTGPVAQVKFAQVTKNIGMTAADFFTI